MSLIAKPEWWSSDHWSTPASVVEALAVEFGPFDLDPCCRKETAKAPKFYTEADDGLAKPWFGKVFMNPPYSKPAPWLAKAIHETSSGAACLVVALLPVRTDTKWFHSLVKDQSQIRFMPGRIKWIGWEGTPIPQPKTLSMLAVYRAVEEVRDAA